MARTPENPESYVPHHTIGGEHAKIKSHGYYNEANLELIFNMEKLPANLKYKEDTNITEIIKKALNITHDMHLIVKGVEEESMETNTLLVRDTNFTKFYVNSSIIGNNINISNTDGLITVDTPDLLDMAEDDVIMGEWDIVNQAGNYLLHYSLNNRIKNGKCFIIINNVQMSYDCEKIECYKKLSFNKQGHITISTEDCYIDRVSLIKIETNNKQVYHISNSTYDPNKKITEYNKETIDLTRYGGFIPPSYTRRL